MTYTGDQLAVREFPRDEIVVQTRLVSLTTVVGGSHPVGSRVQWYRQYMLKCGRCGPDTIYWTPAEKIPHRDAPRKTAEELGPLPCPEHDRRTVLDCPCCLCPTLQAKRFAVPESEEGLDLDPEWLFDEDQSETCRVCGCLVGVVVADDGNFPPWWSTILKGCRGGPCPT